MTGENYKEGLYRLKFIAGINARYHHCLEKWYGRADRLIRIAVAALAVAGLIYAINDSPPVGERVAVAALIVAVILNILPVGDWEKRHGELYRLWADLRKDAELAELKACDQVDNEPILEHCADRISELTAKQHQLDAIEPPPIRWLLRCCQEDETESEYGKGIRTPEQVAQERARLARATSA